MPEMFPEPEPITLIGLDEFDPYDIAIVSAYESYWHRWAEAQTDQKNLPDFPPVDERVDGVEMYRLSKAMGIDPPNVIDGEVGDPYTDQEATELPGICSKVATSSDHYCEPDCTPWHCTLSIPWVPPAWQTPPIDWDAPPGAFREYNDHRAEHHCHQETCEIANSLIPRENDGDKT